MNNEQTEINLFITSNKHISKILKSGCFNHISKRYVHWNFLKLILRKINKYMIKEYNKKNQLFMKTKKIKFVGHTYFILFNYAIY